MKKLLLLFMLLSTPAFAYGLNSCSNMERGMNRPMTYYATGWKNVCIDGNWHWMCY